jgi:HK97 family phage prohead protease
VDKAYENEKGLYVEGRIFFDLSLGREAYILIQNKVTDHLSIGYEAVDFYYHGDVRCITKVKLWEVSVVTFPANEFAEVAVIGDQSMIQLFFIALKYKTMIYVMYVRFNIEFL